MKILPDKVFLLIVVTLLLIAGCTEIYEPEIDQISSQLVVEGLITNQPGPHLVRLTRSSVFGEPFRRVTETGAMVQVVQNQNDTTLLEETRPGYYYTPASFQALPGDTLVLSIETADNLVYLSKPQVMMPPVNPQDVSVDLTKHVFTETLQPSGNIQQYNVDVGNVFLKIAGNESVPRFRIATTLLADYLIDYGPNGYDHCWIRKPINDYLDLDTRENLLIDQPQEHLTGFVPQMSSGLLYMGFPDYVLGTQGVIYGPYRVLVTYFYSLNSESYDFHEARNKQLADEGRFFDPIAAQLPGNMSCISHPDVSVFGLFEVSSVSYTPVWVQFTNGEASAEIVHLVDTIPDTGCFFYRLPPFLNDLN